MVATATAAELPKPEPIGTSDATVRLIPAGSSRAAARTASPSATFTT